MASRDFYFETNHRNSEMKTELFFGTHSIVSVVTTLDSYEKHRLSEWLYGWENLSDLIVIAAIAAMILTTLFAAFIVDGLEEYFNDTKLRRVGVQRVPFSPSSNASISLNTVMATSVFLVSSHNTLEESNAIVELGSDVPRGSNSI